MKKLTNMNIKEILDSTDILISHVSDILYFCEDADTINQFIDLNKKYNLNYRKIKSFLIEHADKLDKQKLLLLIVKNYCDNIKLINTILENKNYKSKYSQSEILELMMQRKKQNENLKIAKNLGKGMDTAFASYFYNKVTHQYDIKIIDSKELIDNITIKNSSNLKRFEKIDETFREANETKTIGIEILLQIIVLTDFNSIFPNEQIGDNMRTLLLENEILKNKIKTRRELETLKSENYNEYDNLITTSKFPDILSDIKNLLKKYIKYVNIDNLLAISAYRFEEGLENDFISPEKANVIKEILTITMNQMKTNKTLNFSLQDKKDYSYVNKDVVYSINDIKNFLNRFTDTSYIKKSQIEATRNIIFSGKLNLSELAPEYINICFSTSELENIAKLNDQNLQYITTKLKWDNNKILNIIKSKNTCSENLIADFLSKKILSANDVLKLYEDKIIDLTQIHNLKNYTDFDDLVTTSKLIDLYINCNENNAKEKNLENYTRYLELYKEILLKDSPEKIESSEVEIMEQMIENYNKNNVSQHINQLEDFYKQGLLHLNTIIEWNDQEVIQKFLTDLYEENIIKLDDVKTFVKNRKLPFEYVKQLAYNEDISYEERMNLLEEGWIPEEEIFELYSKALIKEDDLLKLSQKCIINKNKTYNLINKTQLHDLEKHSNIILEIDDTLKKIKRDNSLYNKEKEKSLVKNDKTTLIIDPNEREEFFSLLKAGKPDRVKISDNSPFYNYEFYIIPDESGKVNLNSVVIAERIYEEKEEHLLNNSKKDKILKYATNNATYFFKYKDLIVLSNYLKKDDALKKSKNIIFKANHTIAKEEKNGRWAADVIYGIAKTMLSSDLKDYSKDNQKKIIIEKLSQVYNYDELIKILDKGSQIDSGEYICEVINDNNIEDDLIK